MKIHTTLLRTTYTFSLFLHLSLSTPLPLALPQGDGTGADSCPTDPLTTDTWTKLDLDKFLSEWTATNVTQTTTNNVQALADSFGAPNFFCGLDSFCNAGQPCLPVQVPAWYAMVAIQNWNSYMNSLNTAINFASSIIGLTLPGIVSDFYPKPKDDITPLLTMGKMFTTILGVIPFTGPVSTASSVVTGSLSFVMGKVKTPVRADLFLEWSSIATSLATVVTDYQGAVSSFIKDTIDAPVNDTNAGINSLLQDGTFLGIAQNFTQSDLQSQVTDSINMFAISLVLQARGVFILRDVRNGCYSNDLDSEICGKTAAGVEATYDMIKDDGNGNAEPQEDFVNLLVSKYGMTKEQILIGPTNCLDANGGKQLADPFNGSLPLDSKTECLFNLLVCTMDSSFPSNTGIVDGCKDMGLAI